MRPARLLRVQLHEVGPFDDAVVRLTPPEPADLADAPTETDTGSGTGIAPRPVTVLFGADGTGKTSLLSAISLTRRPQSSDPPPQGRARRGRTVTAK